MIGTIRRPTSDPIPEDAVQWLGTDRYGTRYGVVPDGREIAVSPHPSVPPDRTTEAKPGRVTISRPTTTEDDGMTVAGFEYLLGDVVARGTYAALPVPRKHVKRSPAIAPVDALARFPLLAGTREGLVGSGRPSAGPIRGAAPIIAALAKRDITLGLVGGQLVASTPGGAMPSPDVAAVIATASAPARRASRGHAPAVRGGLAPGRPPRCRLGHMAEPARHLRRGSRAVAAMRRPYRPLPTLASSLGVDGLAELERLKAGDRPSLGDRAGRPCSTVHARWLSASPHWKPGSGPRYAATDCIDECIEMPRSLEGRTDA